MREPHLILMEHEALENRMYSAPAVFSLNDLSFIDLVHRGDVQITRQLSPTKFTTAVRALDVLVYFSSPHFFRGNIKRMKGKHAAARLIMTSIFDTPKISPWFEKILSLTIVSRSHDIYAFDTTEFCIPNSLSEILGVNDCRQFGSIWTPLL